MISGRSFKLNSSSVMLIIKEPHHLLLEQLVATDEVWCREARATIQDEPERQLVAVGDIEGQVLEIMAIRKIF